MQASCKQKLAGLVGPGNFSDAIIGPVSHGSNAGEHSTRSQTAVCSTNAEQVCSVVRLAMAPEGILTGRARHRGVRGGPHGPGARFGGHGADAGPQAFLRSQQYSRPGLDGPGWIRP